MTAQENNLAPQSSPIKEGLNDSLCRPPDSPQLQLALRIVGKHSPPALR